MPLADDGDVESQLSTQYSLMIMSTLGLKHPTHSNHLGHYICGSRLQPKLLAPRRERYKRRIERLKEINAESHTVLCVRSMVSNEESR